MGEHEVLTVALVGNPNAGKSTLFNVLTGLRQKTGNFPGVTVEKKFGFFKLDNGKTCKLIDLPGTYSLYPKSLDERVVFDTLYNNVAPDYPQLIIVVADASNLKRNLLLFSQVADLGLPVVLALNMIDVAARAGLTIDEQVLAKSLGLPVIKLNSRTGDGVGKLKQLLEKPPVAVQRKLFDTTAFAPELVSEVKEHFKLQSNYLAFHLAQQYQGMANLRSDEKQWLDEITRKHDFKSQSYQAAETIARYSVLSKLMASAVTQEAPTKSKYTQKLDHIFVHKYWGFGIFFLILFLIFQSIFTWAEVPMGLIESGMGAIKDAVTAILPEGALSALITDGVLSGFEGVVVFIPQIALLFAFIAILEETGYMARVVFIMDRLMRRFGLNGKSIVPLISGVACAVPAIMSARGIDNERDRLTSIFVTPLISCSARLPVFTALIALVVPNAMWGGIFNLQGLVLMALYLIGFIAAIVSAKMVSGVLVKSKRVEQSSFFVLELPPYKVPKWSNVGYTIYNSVKSFVFEAGRVILTISIILWVLSNYGPGDAMQQAEQKAQVQFETLVKTTPDASLDNLLQSARLEASYAGHLGRILEPAIRPLGFDWKIGIALVTSFAAREVFIGTMSTIYSMGNDDENQQGVIDQMKAERDPATGGPMFTPARAFSLMIFYLFAMQCMSTLAVTYRETKSWLWPAAQLVYMTGLAWVASFLIYNLLA